MRKLKSPSERWPGFIGIPDEFHYPDLIKFEDMLYDISNLERRTNSRINRVILEYLFGWVEEWGIEGIEQSIEKFPHKPLKEVADFIDWWYEQIEQELIEKPSKNE